MARELTDAPRRLLVTSVAVAVVALAMTGCEGGASAGSRVPTEAEARSVLAQYVASAQRAKDARTYCASSFVAEACEHAFVRAGGLGRVPTAAPVVVDASRTEGGFVRVLVVCGRDRGGHAYRSDFPVERDESGAVRASIPVFWAGTTFSGVHGDEQARTTAQRSNARC